MAVGERYTIRSFAPNNWFISPAGLLRPSRNRQSATGPQSTRAETAPIVLKARTAQARHTVLLECALPGPVLLLRQLIPQQCLFESDAAVANGDDDRALRRTTQRLVFGGGRSSLIDRSPNAGRSIALLTRSSQDRKRSVSGPG